MYTYNEEELNAIRLAYIEDLETLHLKSFPAKESKKYLILVIINDLFTTHKEYTEKEINEILKPVYEDYVLIRRYLVDYHFLERTNDGKVYKKVTHGKENY